jgi:hypothetical protein
VRHLSFAIALLVLASTAVPAFAQGEDPKVPRPPDKTGETTPQAKPETNKPPEQDPALKTTVLLRGANADNTTLARPVPAGPMALAVRVWVDKPFKSPEGQLAATPFQASVAPNELVEVEIVVSGQKTVAGTASLPLSTPGEQQITLIGGRLRYGVTYKGTLSLTVGGQSHGWEITLTTGGQGVISADPIVPLQFVVYPFKDHTGEFEFTLRDKSGTGPYNNLRASYTTGNATVSSDIRSNLDIGQLSFERVGNVPADGKGPVAIALASGKSQTELDQQIKVRARVALLSPGTYVGTLQFAADETAPDAADARLPVTLQVRDHWIMPVLWIIFASAVGWVSAKYIAGERKARQLAAKVRALRERADFLARREAPRAGWQFSSESTSYGLTRVRVGLSRLKVLTSSAIQVLVGEEAITQALEDADTRVSKLEMLRQARQRVEPVADERPGAQLALGRLLRDASQILEAPALNDKSQADFALRIAAAEAWAAPETTLVNYRQALIVRRGGAEMPSAAEIASVTDPAVLPQLQAMFGSCPKEADFSTAPDLSSLQAFDAQLAALLLLWRERGRPWAAALAQSSASQPLRDQFELVDQQFWEDLKNQPLAIERDTTSENVVTAYNIVEITLSSTVQGLITRMLFHPLRVIWTVTLPDGRLQRVTETDGSKLVQYFDKPGKVSISAALHWRGPDIPIPGALTFEIRENPEFRRRPALALGALEWAVLGIATAFAVITAMSTQYGPAFGSYKEYLGLFIWAAGAGGGGNLFKQLGTTSTPGGSADSTLPART